LENRDGHGYHYPQGSRRGFGHRTGGPSPSFNKGCEKECCQ
jgi:hypothetical protein